MHKDFNKWNIVKQKANYRNDAQHLFFKERQVWWCMIGINVGYEQDGKGNLFQRPVLIVKRFNRRMFFGVPLSTKNKSNIYYQNIGTLDHDKFADTRKAIRCLFA